MTELSSLRMTPNSSSVPFVGIKAVFVSVIFHEVTVSSESTSVIEGSMDSILIPGVVTLIKVLKRLFDSDISSIKLSGSTTKETGILPSESGVQSHSNTFEAPGFRFTV